MVCGVSALGGGGAGGGGGGDRDRPEGGVGRSAHQMTSYPSIDFLFFFLADSLDLLTQGNGAGARAHVPAFAMGGSGEAPQQRRRSPSDRRSPGSAGHNGCLLWGQ